MSHRLLGPAALVLLTLAAYANSFGAGFPLDNKGLILEDVRVHEATSANVGLILRHTYWWPHGESGLYRPVTTLSYLFNYAVLGNGDRPAGYHAINLLLHIVNVLLAYALMLRLMDPGLGPAQGGYNRRSGPTAFAVAALWAVLPLSTEAVTNIVGRADLLGAFGVLGGVLMYLKSREARGAARLAWLASLGAMTAIGVFSKESAVAIAAVIAMCEMTWWTRGRSAARWVGPAVALGLPLLVMWQQRAGVLAASPAAEWPFVDNPIVGAGFWIGRLTALEVIARDLWLVVWPLHLSCDYSYAQIPLASGTAGDWAAWGGLALAAAAVAVFARQGPAVWVLAAFAVATLLPSSNLIVFSGTIMAERLMYLPSLGVIGLIVLGLFTAGRAARTPALPMVVIAAAIAAFAVRTWTRNSDWRNDVTLWTSAAREVPQSYKAHEALAEALYGADPTHGNIDRVIAEAERAVAILSPLPDALTSMHAYRQAAAYYLDKADALRREPDDGGRAADADRAYARSLAILERSAAIIEAQTARRPDASTAPAADVQRLLAAAYVGLGDAERARDAAARARSLEPANALAYRLHAAALVGTGRPNDAAVALMVGSMVTADPALGEALLNLYRFHRAVQRRGGRAIRLPRGPDPARPAGPAVTPAPPARWYIGVS